MSDTADPKPLTRTQSKLIDASVVIYGDSAAKKDAAFIARQLMQATLPHKNPGNVSTWIRKNGNLTLIMQQGYDKEGKPYGYPYGTIPRLLLYWMTTEALRNKDSANPRRLDLGHSLKDFMADLGLNPDNGSRGAKRSDARRLNDQMQRFFNSFITFHGDIERDGGQATARLNMAVASEVVFWWSSRNPDQTELWGSYIELGAEFYNAITAAPVPVDKRALKALKGSALALDLYAWLTYEAFRAHKGGKPRFETWRQMHERLGGDYKHIQHFRAAIKEALTKIQLVYPGLKLGGKQGGIEVLPESLTALQPRQTTITGRCKTL